MSDNLDLDQVASSQAQKEVTINDAFGQVDGAITEILLVDLTDGDVSVTMLQAQRYFLLRCSGNAVPRTLTLPQIKRELVIENDGTDTITITRGTTTIDLDGGSLTRVYLDGSTNGLIETGGAGGGGGVALSDATPEALGTAAAGTAIDASRSDHVHPAADLAGTSTTGTLPIAKGGTGATDAATARSNLGVTEGAALSDDTPQPLGTAAAGTSDEASRSDHVHAEPTYADLPNGLPGKPRVTSVAYAASVTLDVTTADVFVIILTGNITVNLTGGVPAQRIQVKLVQDATGGRTVTWGTSVLFGTDLTSAAASTAANKSDYFGLQYSEPVDKYLMVAMARGF